MLHVKRSQRVKGWLEQEVCLNQRVQTTIDYRVGSVSLPAWTDHCAMPPEIAGYSAAGLRTPAWR